MGSINDNVAILIAELINIPSLENIEVVKIISDKDFKKIIKDIEPPLVAIFYRGGTSGTAKMATASQIAIVTVGFNLCTDPAGQEIDLTWDILDDIKSHLAHVKSKNTHQFVFQTESPVDVPGGYAAYMQIWESQLPFGELKKPVVPQVFKSRSKLPIGQLIITGNPPTTIVATIEVIKADRSIVLIKEEITKADGTIIPISPEVTNADGTIIPL